MKKGRKNENIDDYIENFTSDDDDIYSNSSKQPNFENIYSNTSKKKNIFKNFRFSVKSKKIIINSFVLLTSISFIISGGVLFYINAVIDSVNYDDLKTEPSSQVNQSEEKLDPITLDASGSTLLSDPQVLNILFVGTDKREGEENGRSDTLILLSLDNRHKKIKLSSFLRDMWVKIPNSQHDKLNNAYSYGGANLAIKTIENNFRIKIDRYVSVDFSSFIKIVEILGGITINLEKNECKYINKFSREDPKHNLEISNGEKKLTPKQTLCYVRDRTNNKTNSSNTMFGDDFARALRQRIFLKKVLTDVKSSNITTILSILRKIGPETKTNLRKNEILKLTTNILKYFSFPLEEYFVPQHDEYVDQFERGMAVLYIKDFKKTKYKLAKFIYEDTIK
ncbi:MAG: LCP family protein [Oscillospiraceae bacterium]|nr:LCP family protein [Oscillospiraceae bacterium]